MITEYKEIDWAKMKALIDAGSESWQVKEGSSPRDYYVVFAIYKGTVHRCVVWLSQFSSNQATDWTVKRDELLSIYLNKIKTNELKKQSAQPVTSDGRPFVLNNLFAPTHHAAWTSLADDPVTGLRWGGSPFELSQRDIGVSTLNYQFNEWIYFAGGSFSNRGAKHGDNINYKIYAPGNLSLETSNIGGGAFNKYPISAGSNINIYVPSSDSTGSLDLDIVSTFSPEVEFTKAIPVTASNKDGWFDLDLKTYILTVNPNQTGRYNLFDSSLPLATFAAGVRITKDSDVNLMVPAISPKLILPQWIHQVDLEHVQDGSSVDVVWSIFVARKHTY